MKTPLTLTSCNDCFSSAVRIENDSRKMLIWHLFLCDCFKNILPLWSNILLNLQSCDVFTQGFQVLVETEWLDFGHKFADRCGHGENSEDLNERCPVFLQWLDCVHQLQRQFPCSFEFNEAFLVRTCVVVEVKHSYCEILILFRSLD